MPDATVPEGVVRAAAIVDRIFHAILAHRLPAGTKLAESALCDAFAASRATVRRALLMLAERGTVTLHPNRGAFVASPSPAEARAVFEARRVIEATVAANAARSAAAADLAQLRAQLAREARAHHDGNRNEAIRLSGEFHVALADCAGNPVLARFVAGLVARTSLIIGLFGGSAPTLCRSDEHAAILAALAHHDGAAATRLMLAHLGQIEGELVLDKQDDTRIDVAAVLRG